VFVATSQTAWSDIILNYAGIIDQTWEVTTDPTGQSENWKNKAFSGSISFDNVVDKNLIGNPLFLLNGPTINGAVVVGADSVVTTKFSDKKLEIKIATPTFTGFPSVRRQGTTNLLITAKEFKLKLEANSAFNGEIGSQAYFDHLFANIKKNEVKFKWQKAGGGAAKGEIKGSFNSAIVGVPEPTSATIVMLDILAMSLRRCRSRTTQA
jgi:hypothetical protein